MSSKCPSCSKVKKIRIKGYASKTFVPEMKAVNSGNEEKVAKIDGKTCKWIKGNTMKGLKAMNFAVLIFSFA